MVHRPIEVVNAGVPVAIRFPRGNCPSPETIPAAERERLEIGRAEVLREGATILSISENGYGKRTPTEDYRLTGRGAQGVISLDTG